MFSPHPFWADRAGSTGWQILPACPDQQTSTDLPDQFGSGDHLTAPGVSVWDKTRT
jgi:hypothetical protein